MASMPRRSSTKLTNGRKQMISLYKSLAHNPPSVPISLPDFTEELWAFMNCRDSAVSLADVQRWIKVYGWIIMDQLLSKNQGHGPMGFTTGQMGDHHQNRNQVPTGDPLVQTQNDQSELAYLLTNHGQAQSEGSSAGFRTMSTESLLGSSSTTTPSEKTSSIGMTSPGEQDYVDSSASTTTPAGNSETGTPSPETIQIPNMTSTSLNNPQMSNGTCQNMADFLRHRQHPQCSRKPVGGGAHPWNFQYPASSQKSKVPHHGQGVHFEPPQASFRHHPHPTPTTSKNVLQVNLDNEDPLSKRVKWSKYLYEMGQECAKDETTRSCLLAIKVLERKLANKPIVPDHGETFRAKYPINVKTDLDKDEEFNFDHWHNSETPTGNGGMPCQGQGQDQGQSQGQDQGQGDQGQGDQDQLSSYSDEVVDNDVIVLDSE